MSHVYDPSIGRITAPRGLTITTKSQHLIDTYPNAHDLLAKSTKQKMK